MLTSRPDRKNICVVHGNVDGGSGSGRYVADMAARFAEDEHQVTLLCHECEAPLEESGVEVIRIPRPTGALGTWRLIQYVQIHAIRSFARRNAKRFSTFDTLFGSDLVFLRAIRPHAKQARIVYTPLSMIAPLEIRSYSLGGLRAWISERLYHRLQRWALLECDHLVRFTPNAIRALEEYYLLDVSEKAIAAVYVSRQFEGLTGDSVTLNRPVPRELLWVGRLDAPKNVQFLIRAVSLIRTDVPWRLVICGDGPKRGELEQMVIEFGLGDRIHFAGRVPDVRDLYATASLFLTGSLLEQYSLTLMEAYSYAVPCIALKADWKTVFNSVEDQILDGVTGYAVGNEEEMAERISELLADELKRQDFARAGLERKNETFGFEGFFAEIRSLVVRIDAAPAPTKDP